MTAGFAPTVTDFADWLHGKPRDEYYHYTDPWNCAIAQYLKARGVGDVGVCGNEYHVLPDRDTYHHLPIGFNIISQGSSNRSKWTFGDAYERARVVEVLIDAGHLRL